MNNDSTLEPRIFVRSTAMAERLWNNELYHNSPNNADHLKV